jgi:hypothetical protein
MLASSLRPSSGRVVHGSPSLPQSLKDGSSACFGVDQNLQVRRVRLE